MANIWEKAKFDNYGKFESYKIWRFLYITKYVGEWRRVISSNLKKPSILGLFSDIALKVMNGPNFVPDNL